METSKKDARFIEWKAVDGRFEASIRKNAVSAALNKMGKLKMMILPDGERITTEITKKQREILDALQMCA